MFVLQKKAFFLLSLVYADNHEFEFGINPDDPCEHENPELYPVSEIPISLNDGESIYRETDANFTHFYEFAVDTLNTTLLDQPDNDRKVIFNLEPCKGEVYLFVRKTRRCFPNPYSCLKTNPVLADDTTGESQSSLPQPSECLFTHFVSRVDGTRDGAGTFFELPLTSSRYYLSIYAKTRAAYTLLGLTDIGQYPRAGGHGDIHAYQTNLPLEVDLSWKPAYFSPDKVYTGWPMGEPVPDGREIATIRRYHVYSAMLLDKDKRTNANVFLTSNKIMNTVCGLQNNTHRAFNTTLPEQCGSHGYCNQTIHGVILNRRYVFNVVAETNMTDKDGNPVPGYMTAYSGLIVTTDWDVTRQEAEDSEIMKVLPPLFGGVLGLTVTLYIWMVNWY